MWDDVVFVGVGFVVGNMVTIDDVCERRQWCVRALIGNDDRGSNVVVFAGRFGSVLIKFKTLFLVLFFPFYKVLFSSCFLH